MKKISSEMFAGFGDNMLFQSAGDNNSTPKGKHVSHRKWNSELQAYTTCVFCRDEDHWKEGYDGNDNFGEFEGYRIPDSFGYGYYGYGWYICYMYVYYDIWHYYGYSYEGSNVYFSEGPNGGEIISNGGWITIDQPALDEKDYDNILNKFMDGTDSRVVGEFMGDNRTVTVEYDENLNQPGLYNADTDTIRLGPDANYDTFMREMFHAVDVPQQDPRYNGNSEIAELAFGREMNFDSPDKYKAALINFQLEMQRVTHLDLPDDLVMQAFTQTTWDALVEIRSKEEAYEKMKFDKNSFNPWPYLKLAEALKKARKLKREEKERKLKLVPVRVRKKPFPKKDETEKPL